MMSTGMAGSRYPAEMPCLIFTDRHALVTVCLMRVPRVGACLARYPLAWAYLGGVMAAGLAIALLPSARASALQQWASTNVENLQHHPVAALVVSAFLPSASALAWLLIIPLAMFGATRPFGNLWLA